MGRRADAKFATEKGGHGAGGGKPAAADRAAVAEESGVSRAVRYPWALLPALIYD